MKEVDNINSQNGSEIENYENEIKTNEQNNANNNIEVPKAAEPDNINDNKKNVEIYDLTDDDIDNSDYVEKVKNSAPVVKKAYKVQTTKEDKILFGVLNSVINDVNQTTILPEDDMKIEFHEGTTEEEKQSAIDEAKKKLANAANERALAGLNPKMVTTEVEDETSEYIDNAVFPDLIGDGSRDSIEDSFRALGVVLSWNTNNQGKVYDSILKSIPEGTPQREKKAAYLAYMRQTTETRITGALQSFNVEFIRALTYANEAGEKARTKIWDNLKFNKDTTTFDQFFAKLGFTPDEQQLYLDKNGFNRKDKVFDAFKKKNSLDKPNNELSEEEISLIVEDIYTDYTQEFSNIVVNKGMKVISQYYTEYYNEHMTVNHFMNICELNDEQKADFLAHYNVKNTDKLLDLLKAEFDRRPDFQAKCKAQKRESGNQNVDEVTEEDYKNLGSVLLNEEFIGKRAKTAKLESKYSDALTIEEYMNILEMSEMEKNNFLADNGFAAGDKVKDSYLKLLALDEKYKNKLMEDKQKAGQEPDITDDDIKKYVMSEFSAILDERASKKIESTSLWGRIIVNFPNYMDVHADKVTFNNGFYVGGGEGLVPKVNPKTDAQKEFKKWAQTEGEQILRNVRFDDLKNSFKTAYDKIHTVSPINIRNDDAIAGYYNDKVPVTNVTFLRGVIDRLESTGTGKRYFKTSKDRDTNSKAYDSVMRTLKSYYSKLATGDKTDLLDTKNALKEYCLAYIDGKETKRSREFGQIRFDTVMTVLYDILPTKEFNAILRTINHKRGVGANSPDYVSRDKYNTMRMEIYSLEENKEEERQVVAESINISKILPDWYLEQYNNVMSVFGMSPENNERLSAVFGENINEKFPNVQAEYAQIGNGLKEGRTLSDNDFAAIAYAGALTSSAASLDERGKGAWDVEYNKTLVTGKDYTSILAKKPIPAEAAGFANVMQAGRQGAVDVMNEYKKGNKVPLATMLTDGIRQIAASCRLSRTVDDSFLINGEMARRMVAMIERDNTLRAIVNTQIAKDYKRITEDMNYISSVCQIGKIYAGAEEARNRLDKSSKEPELYPLSENDKIELATDILMLNVINNAKDVFYKYMDESIKTKSTYKNKVRDINNKDIEETDDAIAIEDEAERNKAIDNAALNKKVRMAVVRDYFSDDKLIRSLTSDNATASLRESVKKLVKDNGFKELSPGQIIEKMNDKKIVQKLASVTAKSNEESAKETSKKIETEKLEKDRAAEAKRKRDAKLGRNH